MARQKRMNELRNRTLDDARRGLKQHEDMVSKHRRKLDAEAWQRFGEWSDPGEQMRMLGVPKLESNDDST